MSWRGANSTQLVRIWCNLGEKCRCARTCFWQNFGHLDSPEKFAEVVDWCRFVAETIKRSGAANSAAPPSGRKRGKKATAGPSIDHRSDKKQSPGNPTAQFTRCVNCFALDDRLLGERSSMNLPLRYAKDGAPGTKNQLALAKRLIFKFEISNSNFFSWCVFFIGTREK